MSESLRDLVVNLSLNGDNFSSNLSAINKQIKEAESEFAAASAGVDGFEKTLEGSRAKVDALTKKYDLQSRAVEQYQRALTASEGKLSQTAEVQEKLKKSLEEARAEYEAVAAAEGKDSAAAKELADKIKTLEGQISANEKTMQRQANAVTTASTNLNNAKAALAGTEAELKKANEELEKSESGWTKAAAGMQAFSSGAAKLGQNLEKVGRGLTVGVTTPIAALGTACVKAFNDVDEGLDIIVTKTGASGAALESMQDSMKNVFGSLAVDADEAGTAIGEVNTRFGLMGETLEQTAAEFLKFSKITGADVNSSIDDVDSIMEKFGVDVEHVGEVLGLIAKVGQDTGITVSAITGSLKTNGAALKEIGLDLESSIMLMAQFEKNGVDASTALMSIKTAVKNAAKDGQDAQEALKTTMAAIRDAATETDALTLAIELFGSRGAAEMADAIRTGRLDIDQLAVSMASYKDIVTDTYEATLDLPDQAKVAFNNLKIAGQQLADTAFSSLAPLGQQILTDLKGLVETVGEMDQATVMSIIRMAAIAAAAGPVVSVAGKLTKGISSVSEGLGKFAGKVAEAGGGWKGFSATLASSPVAWMALAAAVGVATYKLIDYASGAKAAREAMEDMNATAEEWTGNTANTFYSQSQGLTRFGMSAKQFAGDVESARNWLSRLTSEWSDDYAESDETVNAYIESWKKASSATTGALQEIADSAAENGYDALYKQTKSYIAEIDTIDSRMEALLKKKQEYKLTDADIAELNALIERREQIEIEYKIKSVDTSGFAELDAAIDAEKARAAAAGEQLGLDFYQDAMVAAAQGMKEVNSALDEEYSSRYKTIGLIKDEKEQQKALANLDLWYQQERQDAADRYAQTLGKYVGEVWNNSDYQQVYSDMGELLNLVDEYTRTKDATPLAEFAKTLDPDKITEYYGVMTQIAELESSGMNLETIGEKLGMTPEDVMQIRDSFNQLQFIRDSLGSFTNDEMLQPLRDIFGDLGDEVVKIATDLDMTGATAAWKEWAQNPGTNILAELDETNLPKEMEIPAIVDASGKLINPPTEQAVTAYVDANGVVHNLPVTHTVTVTADAGGTLTNPPTEQTVTAYVDANGEIHNVPQSAGSVGVTLNSDGTVTGLPESENITAIVTSDGTIINVKTETNVTAKVTSDGTVEGLPTTKNVTAVVTSDGTIYNLNTSVPVDVTLNSLQDTQVALWRAKNAPKLKLDADVTPTTVGTAFGEDYFTDLLALYNAGKAKFYDASGAVMEVTPEVIEALSKDALVAGMSEDGTYHISVTPEWAEAGAEEVEQAMEQASEELSRTWTGFGFAPNTLEKAAEQFTRAISMTQKHDNGNWLYKIFGVTAGDVSDAWYKAEAAIEKDSEEVVAESLLSAIAALQNGVEIDADTLESVRGYAELIDSINTGAQMGHSTNEIFMATLINGLRQLGIVIDQNDIPGYIKDLAGAATPTAGEHRQNLIRAEDTANYILQMKALAMAYEDGNAAMEDMNPKGAVMMGEAMDGFDKLLGEGGLQNAVDELAALAAAGGQLSEDDLNLMAAYSQALTALGRDVPAEVTAALEGTDLSSLGFNMSSGIASGILSGKSAVVSAMLEVTNAALAAARESMDIHSPSRVFRDQIGAMMSKGIGVGFVDEMKTQAAIIRNAMQYLSDEARGAISHQNYAIDSSVTITGNTFSIRSDDDIGSLAREIAALTRRQQAGRGYKGMR